MTQDDIKIPKDLRGRLRDIAGKHGLGSLHEVARHFVTRGLDRYGAPPGACDVHRSAPLRSIATIMLLNCALTREAYRMSGNA